MSLFEKLAHMIGDRKVPIPAMPGVRVPGISFGSKSTLKIIFFTVFVAAAAVGTGMFIGAGVGARPPSRSSNCLMIQDAIAE